jgi:hypothetical protein
MREKQQEEYTGNKPERCYKKYLRFSAPVALSMNGQKKRVRKRMRSELVESWRKKVCASERGCAKCECGNAASFSQRKRIGFR